MKFAEPIGTQVYAEYGCTHGHRGKAEDGSCFYKSMASQHNRLRCANFLHVQYGVANVMMVAWAEMSSFPPLFVTTFELTVLTVLAVRI